MSELRYRIRNGLWRLWARWPLGSGRTCCMCNRHVGRFLPYLGGSAGAPRLMHALEVVGSDLDHHECPACGCHDRERHLLLYLRASGLLEWMSGKHVLHLAPEKHLRDYIRESAPANHVMGDLFPTSPEITKIDVLALPQLAETFDIVIANHLLEHVESLDQALTELARVLRPGGYAILQTPFSPVLTSAFEDEGIKAPAQRLQAYGQEDHVRLFGRDIAQRIERFGFESRVQAHAALLSGIDSARYGVNPSEPFMLFARKAG